MWIKVRGASGLGAALTQARKAAGLTQAGLAERIGAERTTVLNMEQGRNPALRRLVDAFSVLGYELVVVPRTATLVVDESDRGADGRG